MLGLACEKWVLEFNYYTPAIARMFRDITYRLDFNTTIDIVRDLADTANMNRRATCDCFRTSGIQMRDHTLKG